MLQVISQTFNISVKKASSMQLHDPLHNRMIHFYVVYENTKDAYWKNFLLMFEMVVIFIVPTLYFTWQIYWTVVW